MIERSAHTVAQHQRKGATTGREVGLPGGRGSRNRHSGRAIAPLTLNALLPSVMLADSPAQAQAGRRSRIARGVLASGAAVCLALSQGTAALAAPVAGLK